MIFTAQQRGVTIPSFPIYNFGRSGLTILNITDLKQTIFPD